MNDKSNIFDIFCEYIDYMIFSEERIGSAVSFFIDQSFIDSFCKRYEIRLNDLLDEVFQHLSEIRPSILHIKGILAIQLLAASQRENSDGMTEANYRNRLSNLLNWEINDLQRWMEDHQEKYWEALYKWCDDNFFEITKCYPKSGAGRYVQYPIQQAERVFTIEDLKYLAAAFVKENLHAFEILSENDFWRIMHWTTLMENAHTKHSQNILSNEEYRKEAKRQIYNFFNYWNGEYKTRVNNKTQKTEKEETIILLNKKLDVLEVRDSHLKLRKKLNLADLSYATYRNHCPVRRAGMVVFKPFDIYDDYYIETRYLEPEGNGIAILFKGYATHPIKDHTWNQIVDLKYLKLFKINYEDNVDDLYVQKETFKLSGGLKISRNGYLEHGGPLLQIDHPTTVWINGTQLPNKTGFINLKDLPVGSNTLKIQGEKTIIIEIWSDSKQERNWHDSYNKWILDKYKGQWCNAVSEKGVVGLDFSEYASSTEITDNIPISEAWAKTMNGIDTPSKNYIIKNLKNIINHE